MSFGGRGDPKNTTFGQKNDFEGFPRVVFETLTYLVYTVRTARMKLSGNLLCSFFRRYFVIYVMFIPDKKLKITSIAMMTMTANQLASRSMVF